MAFVVAAGPTVGGGEEQGERDGLGGLCELLANERDSGDLLLDVLGRRQDWLDERDVGRRGVPLQRCGERPSAAPFNLE